MAEENQKKWLEISHSERIEFFDKLLNKEILFTTKLLFLYLDSLKKMDKTQYTDSIELVEEGFTDRLIILGKQVKIALLFITKE